MEVVKHWIPHTSVIVIVWFTCCFFEIAYCTGLGLSEVLLLKALAEARMQKCEKKRMIGFVNI